MEEKFYMIGNKFIETCNSNIQNQIESIINMAKNYAIANKQIIFKNDYISGDMSFDVNECQWKITERTKLRTAIYSGQIRQLANDLYRRDIEYSINLNAAGEMPRPDKVVKGFEILGRGDVVIYRNMTYDETQLILAPPLSSPERTFAQCENHSVSNTLFINSFNEIVIKKETMEEPVNYYRSSQRRIIPLKITFDLPITLIRDDMKNINKQYAADEISSKEYDSHFLEAKSKQVTAQRNWMQSK